MPGVRGPSDYSQEPLRHPSLKINSKVFDSVFFFLFIFVDFQGILWQFIEMGNSEILIL